MWKWICKLSVLIITIIHDTFCSLPYAYALTRYILYEQCNSICKRIRVTCIWIWNHNITFEYKRKNVKNPKSFEAMIIYLVSQEHYLSITKGTIIALSLFSVVKYLKAYLNSVVTSSPFWRSLSCYLYKGEGSSCIGNALNEIATLINGSSFLYIRRRRKRNRIQKAK